MKLKTHFILLFVCFVPIVAVAQLERKLVNEKLVEELTFHAPKHINVFTVEPLSKQELHFSIMHTFNTLDNGPRNLWGLDNGANIRLSFEYGITSKLSAGFGRSSLDKVFDFFARYHILQQTQDGRMPFSLSLMGSSAINTSDYSFIAGPPVEGTDRWSFFGQVMLARKFGDSFSAQLTPMLAHFANMRTIFAVEGGQDTYVALGVSGKWKFSRRTSLTAQWIPNLNSDLRNNVGIGLDVEAGGHVFQMYFVTSPALAESYLLAGGNGAPIEGFRLGFNVNRIFSIGKGKKKTRNE